MKLIITAAFVVIFFGDTGAVLVEKREVHFGRIVETSHQETDCMEFNYLLTGVAEFHFNDGGMSGWIKLIPGDLRDASGQVPSLADVLEHTTNTMGKGFYYATTAPNKSKRETVFPPPPPPPNSSNLTEDLSEEELRTRSTNKNETYRQLSTLQVQGNTKDERDCCSCAKILSWIGVPVDSYVRINFTHTESIGQMLILPRGQVSGSPVASSSTQGHTSTDQGSGGAVVDAYHFPAYV